MRSTTETTPASTSCAPRHWVVFRLGHLGDVMLITGVLAYLAKTRGWTFSVMTAPEFAGIFTGNPYVARVIPVDKQALTAHGFAALARKLAAENAGSGLLDLHGSLRSRVLGAFWQGPVSRYPKMSCQRRLYLATHAPMLSKALRACPVTQRYIMAVQQEPPSPAELSPRVWLAEGEIAAAGHQLGSLFTHTGQSPVRPVALHPFATHALKAWPAAHWKKLAALLDEQGIPWVGLGKGQALYPERPNDLTNTTSLRQTFALLAQCRALVTGDSGPMHMAAAVGTPVVALFGPTTREWGFFPQGAEDTVLETDLSCRPCSLHGKNPCPKNGECLSAITPERVLAHIPGPAGAQAPPEKSGSAAL